MGSQGPPSARQPQVGELTSKTFYQLADGRVIEVDPNNPAEAEAQLGGPIVASLPANWTPGAQDEALQNLYHGAQPEVDYFRDSHFAPLNANYLFPPMSGLPMMDPTGILNPASMPPLTPEDLPKQIVGRAPHLMQRRQQITQNLRTNARYFCC